MFVLDIHYVTSRLKPETSNSESSTCQTCMMELIPVNCLQKKLHHKRIRKITRNNYSLPFISTCCHLLQYSLSFVGCTTHCHSLSFVFTWCITRLSFYKPFINIKRHIEWQRITTSGKEWWNHWQRVTTSDNELQWVVILANFPFYLFIYLFIYFE